MRAHRGGGNVVVVVLVTADRYRKKDIEEALTTAGALIESPCWVSQKPLFVAADRRTLFDHDLDEHYRPSLLHPCACGMSAASGPGSGNQSHFSGCGVKSRSTNSSRATIELVFDYLGNIAVRPDCEGHATAAQVRVPHCGGHNHRPFEHQLKRCLRVNGSSSAPARTGKTVRDCR